LSAAARAAVYIHATAADLASIDHGERGLLATDLLPYIRYLVNPA
jgi:NAD(P)H-hydrate repair Nnr-like enzyme with NAD(P)H-hydrate dehydratase domain